MQPVDYLPSLYSAHEVQTQDVIFSDLDEAQSKLQQSIFLYIVHKRH